MPPQIQFLDGKILFVEGQIAMGPACCCVNVPCCPDPPASLLFQIPIGIIETPQTPNSTQECDACESIPGTYSVTNESVLAWPGAECDAINDFDTLTAAALGVAGVRVGGWWYKASDICSISVQHHIFDIGCLDNEEDTVDFAIRVSLFYDAETGKCYFATIWGVWTPSPSGPALCSYYAFGFRDIGTNGYSAPNTCTSLPGNSYLMEVMPDESSPIGFQGYCSICFYNAEVDDVLVAILDPPDP